MNRTEGIVLRSVNYGETHKIVTIITPFAGKIAVMAKGARKPVSRLAAVTQPFVKGLYLLFGGHSGMASVSQADIVESYPKIRNDLWKTAYAVYFCELIDRHVDDGNENHAVYNFLSDSFDLLSGDKDAEILARIFEMKIIQMAGIEPMLDRCAHCGRTEDVFERFSIRYGGPLCSYSVQADPMAIRIVPATLRLLRVFQRMDVASLGDVNLGTEVRRQIDKILRLFLEEHSGVMIRSRQFLDQLIKYDL